MIPRDKLDVNTWTARFKLSLQDNFEYGTLHFQGGGAWTHSRPRSFALR